MTPVEALTMEMRLLSQLARNTDPASFGGIDR